ncbi:MAG: type I DNA topoisomerase [bacterium]|uniref:DNA topoisomerase 1 n=1 Tax=Candidatus Methylomirabilis tolerans TaxID=3123416 RepID=A0AAJ1AHU9_9BACT|nr:type I DNA topoisomerase [Candidatus Methylomirabilis sp.]
MPKSLVIVESPAKAKTIDKYLGKAFVVMASMGHIRDLPAKSLSVDVEHDFTPQYEIIAGREKVMAALKKAAKTADAIYLAADPDREGEAICWHLQQELGAAKKPVHRVTFNEITKRAVREAFNHPSTIDQQLVDAQQARRILDRLVGYQISPLLWDKVKRGLSAGRVQSVALRLIVDREREIKVFVKTEYWSVDVALEGRIPPAFMAGLHKIDGERVNLPNQERTDQVVGELSRQEFRVTDLTKKEKRRNPVPPFTTSKLQQEAVRKLRFTARRAMQIAQQLYEGIEIGQEGAVGLITYMRTDSVRVSQEAQTEAARYIAERFGQTFVPERPPAYRSGRGAQEAHEAIRPTSVYHDPASLRQFLTKDQLALYTLIWSRFVASQMLPALYDVTTATIQGGRFTLRASGRHQRFAGFMQVYIEGRDEASETKPVEAKDETAEGTTVEEEAELAIPPLEVGEQLRLLGVTPAQHFTQPPPRFTEATLVKELEELGIGRPSTYATILNVIQNRDYVVKTQGKFRPTELGGIVVDLLIESFPRVMDYEFTAKMETTLDEIEEGQKNWREEMQRFYEPFAQWVKEAAVGMRNIKAMEEKTDEICERCGSRMAIRWGRFGRFLACTNYPECKGTRELPPELKEENGTGEDASTSGETEATPCENCGRPMVMKRGRFGPFLGCSGYPECKTIRKISQAEAGGARPAPQPTDEVCEKCGSQMVLREGRFGRFLSCSTYPTCKHVKPISIGVDCPQCRSPLSERRTKRGRVFYGCTAYPKCAFAIWDRPIQEPCPRCGAAFLVEKKLRGGGVSIRCAAEGCAYAREADATAQVKA